MSPKRSINLRRIEEKDLSLIFLWRNDHEVYRWCRQNDRLHMQNHVEWFHAQAKDKSMSMYVVLTDDFDAVGVCGLTSIDYINSRAEFSLYIDPDRQGDGLGESALRALVRKGFVDYGLNCIWGEAFEDNPAVRMFNRVGFKEEGMRREFYFRDGKYIDAISFSLLRSEYVE